MNKQSNCCFVLTSKLSFHMEKMVLNINFNYFFTWSNVAKIFCTLGFFVHCSINILQNDQSNKMSIESEDVKLSSIAFPVVFKISISPGFDMDQLKQLGFQSIQDYFMGINQHNPTGYDWVGGNNNISINKSSSGMVNITYFPTST